MDTYNGKHDEKAASLLGDAPAKYYDVPVNRSIYLERHHPPMFLRMLMLLKWLIYSVAATIFCRALVPVIVTRSSLTTADLSSPRTRPWETTAYWLHTKTFTEIVDVLGLKDPRVPVGRLAEQFLTVTNFSTLSASSQRDSQPRLAESGGDLQTAEDFLLLMLQEFSITQPATQRVYSAGCASSRAATLAIPKRTAPAAWIDVYLPVLNARLEPRLEILGNDDQVVWTAELEGVVDGSDAWSSDFRDDSMTAESSRHITYPVTWCRSAQHLVVHPGNPTTVDCPACENPTGVKRTNIPPIPSLQMSESNAKILLEELTSGRNRTVRLVHRVGAKATSIRNTMGVIPGHIKDEIIVIGNHRDTRVLGSADQLSGTGAFIQIVHDLGALLREGWKPLRTIVIASWDAEQNGLIGSTQWGEDFTDFIQHHVVAYLNFDSAILGSLFEAQASPLLAHFIRGTAMGIPHPMNSSRTLWDATLEECPHGDAESLAMDIKAAGTVDGVGVLPLGADGDFTVFLQRAGVPSLVSGFRRLRSDSFYHGCSAYEPKRDHGLSRRVAVAKVLGRQMLRLSDSLILPFNTTHYAFELESYLNNVEELAAAASIYADLGPLRRSIESLQFASFTLDHMKFGGERSLKDVLGYSKADDYSHFPYHEEEICDQFLVRHPDVTPPMKHIAMHTSHNRYRNSNRRPAMKGPNQQGSLETATLLRVPHATNLQTAPPSYWPFPSVSDPQMLIDAWKYVRNVNRKLANFERGFIHEEGLKGREWYQHLVVAPDKLSGIGTPLPGLMEAITMKNTTLLEYEAGRLKEAVDKIAASLYV